MLALDVDPAQQQFVASNGVWLAEAHFNPCAWFRAVYADDTLVGFVMLFDPTVPGAIASDPVEPTDMVLWRLMIDRQCQRQRLGRRTLDAVREHITSMGRFRLLTSCIPGPGGPGDFYLAYGFNETGRLWDDGTDYDYIGARNIQQALLLVDKIRRFVPGSILENRARSNV